MAADLTTEKSCFDFRQGQEDFPYSHSFLTGPGATASYSAGTGFLSPGLNRPGREADHSPLFSANVNSGDFSSLPHIPTWYAPGQCIFVVFG